MGYAAFIASSCSTATQRAVKCSGFPASIDSAGVAQLVEQRIRNAKVVGSTPISGTNRAQRDWIQIQIVSLSAYLSDFQDMIRTSNDVP